MTYFWGEDQGDIVVLEYEQEVARFRPATMTALRDTIKLIADLEDGKIHPSDLDSMCK
jgi:hypothetical protein